jgi:hypothetical protein
VAVLIGELSAAQVHAADYYVGPIHIAQPWARATPKGAKSGAGYLTGPGSNVALNLILLAEIHVRHGVMNCLAASLQSRPQHSTKRTRQPAVAVFFVTEVS